MGGGHKNVYGRKRKAGCSTASQLAAEIWTRAGYVDPDEEECNNSQCDLELSNKDVLITEEGSR